MTYAAYLRIYEPVSAFHEPDRSRWAAYATSPTRPRRRDSLMVEHAEALRRAITAPQIVVPDQESEHAYVRRADGITYICPWQTRLRCLLAYGRMLSATGAPLPGTVPAGDDDQAMAVLARLEEGGAHGLPARLHILASVWTVPLAWFVPFTATERWLSLGPGRHQPSAAATASATRALIYTTPMSSARRRVARTLTTLRDLPSELNDAVWNPERAESELTEVGRWLAEFHPYSLVELDYGGLVHLLSDDELCGDQSVAEIRAAIDGAAKGECELAVAMYKRAHSRWRAFAEFELANLVPGLAGPARRTLFPNLPRYFRICHDATISITRLTLSDSDQRSNWAFWDRNFARGGRRVTAGDGNMVSVGHMGHPRQAPHGASGNTRNAGSQHWSRRRGHTHVRTYTRG